MGTESRGFAKAIRREKAQSGIPRSRRDSNMRQSERQGVVIRDGTQSSAKDNRHVSSSE